MINWTRLTTRIFSLTCTAMCMLPSHATTLPIDQDKLVSIAFDSFKPHEALPDGVPLSFNWARAPRVAAGNNSKGFSAATGWGQVFYSKGATSELSLFVIRNFQSFLCTLTSSEPHWQITQRGTIEGNQFRADFAGNTNTKPLIFRENINETEISFESGSAFHFWPKAGRFGLPKEPVCGVLVLLEAKQISGTPKSLLIGLGADYWTTKTAAWDNYKTNTDIAIGRLKHLTTDWQWFGLNTASGEALRVLIDHGYMAPP